MINLCNRTEYSFRLAFGLLEKVLDANDKNAAGICDRHGTWGHVSFEKACRKRDIKPIFGVELAVVNEPELNENEGLRFLRFIALTNDGLKEIYELVTLATGQFHYFPRLSLKQVGSISTNVLILTTLPVQGANQNIFLDLNPTTPYSSVQWAIENGISPVATSDNFYPTPEDEDAYGVCMGKFADTKTTPQFILDEWDWDAAVEAPEDFKKSAMDNIAPIIQDMDIKLPVAELVHPKVTQTLREMCEDGAKVRKIDLSNPEYKDRLDRELKLIADKDFEDYFFLISDLCKEAKKTMLVGPARGSSCGSLVCYLIDITEIDPIPYNLLFERFIDVNRADLPDIDIDFPDKKRDQIFDYLKNKYGEECVAQLGTISRFKPKSAIGQVSKELNIPMWEVQELKDAIIERSGGDARASFCIADTFKELEIGQRTLKKYPELIISAELEGHASHSGRHAAGIVVTSNPVSWYCSVDQQTGAAQVDKYDAEDLNLLKIDALGLRTLSVIEDALEQIGWSYKQLIDYRLDDQGTFDLLNEAKWAGIFQFEGYALQSLCHQFTVDKFEDIIALTALARPGPLNSGMANEWIRRKVGAAKVTYDHPMMENSLKTSFGVVVYQEQIMQIAREVGLMSWEDVSSLRKAMSKSMGKEFFDKYRKQFLEGAAKNNFKEEDAIEFWDKINTFGSWCFNRSHAVAYGMVSYWCLVLKANYPLEYAAACLRNSKDDDQSIKLLRELDYEGYGYKPFDYELSEENWTVRNGTLIGGLIGIKGIGPKTAADIIMRRKEGKALTKRQDTVLKDAKTPYDMIFEGRERWGYLYDNPTAHKINSKLSFIREITNDTDGQVCFIAKLAGKNQRDHNETVNIHRRGGREMTGQTLYLNFTVEDDTDLIFCTIDRWKYLEYGKPIIEEGKIGDWYIFKGNVQKGWRKVHVKRWKKLS